MKAILFMPLMLLGLGISAGSLDAENAEKFGTASGKVQFVGKEHTFSHPVASIGVWDRRRGEPWRKLRIDLFQDPPLEKHIGNIKKWGNTSMMGSDFKNGKLPPHLMLSLSVNEADTDLKKDAVQNLSVSVTGISNPSLAAGLSGPKVTAASIVELSGKLALGQVITGKIKGKFGQGERECSYEIVFSVKVIADSSSPKKP